MKVIRTNCCPLVSGKDHRKCRRCRRSQPSVHFYRGPWAKDNTQPTYRPTCRSCLSLPAILLASPPVPFEFTHTHTCSTNFSFVEPTRPAKDYRQEILARIRMNAAWEEHVVRVKDGLTFNKEISRSRFSSSDSGCIGNELSTPETLSNHSDGDHDVLPIPKDTRFAHKVSSLEAVSPNDLSNPGSHSSLLNLCQATSDQQRSKLPLDQGQSSCLKECGANLEGKGLLPAAANSATNRGCPHDPTGKVVPCPENCEHEELQQKIDRYSLED